MCNLGYVYYLEEGKKKVGEEYHDTNWALVIVKIVMWSNVIALFFWAFGHLIYVVGRGTTYGFFSFAFLIVSSFG